MPTFYNCTKLAWVFIFNLGHFVLNGLCKICVPRIGGMGGMVSPAGPARKGEVRVCAAGVGETMGLFQVE